jgi:hypothetical protein
LIQSPIRVHKTQELSFRFDDFEGSFDPTREHRRIFSSPIPNDESQDSSPAHTHTAPVHQQTTEMEITMNRPDLAVLPISKLNSK